MEVFVHKSLMVIQRINQLLKKTYRTMGSNLELRSQQVTLTLSKCKSARAVIIHAIVIPLQLREENGKDLVKWFQGWWITFTWIDWRSWDYFLWNRWALMDVFLLRYSQGVDITIKVVNVMSTPNCTMVWPCIFFLEFLHVYSIMTGWFSKSKCSVTITKSD